jgi:hypothetical protein
LSGDWTAIRLETLGGYQFTPTYGPDARPTIWNPDEFNGSIPRGEVHAAWDELARTYQLRRVYCDRREWDSEITAWSLLYGDEVFLTWETYRTNQMAGALRRFVTDVTTGALTHDGCPITATHIRNARKLAKPGDQYIIGKPNQAQKIDAAVASVICHEAAADATAAGWSIQPRRRMVVRR